MRLTGFEAIEFAEKHRLLLNQKADAVNEARHGLSVAEAEAVASEDAGLIWLDVDKDEYYTSPPADYQPER